MRQRRRPARRGVQIAALPPQVEPARRRTPPQMCLGEWLAWCERQAVSTNRRRTRRTTTTRRRRRRKTAITRTAHRFSPIGRRHPGRSCTQTPTVPKGLPPTAQAGGCCTQRFQRWPWRQRAWRNDKLRSTETGSQWRRTPRRHAAHRRRCKGSFQPRSRLALRRTCNPRRWQPCGEHGSSTTTSTTMPQSRPQRQPQLQAPSGRLRRNAPATALTRHLHDAKTFTCMHVVCVIIIRRSNCATVSGANHGKRMV